jgi:hypothetical protein
VNETKALFELIFAVLLQEKRLSVINCKLMVFSLAASGKLLNLFKIMNSCGLI